MVKVNGKQLTSVYMFITHIYMHRFYIYVHICIQTHTCTHTYIYTHILQTICGYVYPHIHVCIYG